MRFLIKALTHAGSVVARHVEAASADEAQRQARAEGLMVVSLQPETVLRGEIFARRARFPLVQFAHELLALVEAGLSLVESIEALYERQGRGPVATVLERVNQRLREGATLSRAMNELPSAFPALFVATVRATERTGDLPDALRRFLAYQAQLDSLRKKVVSAAIYPVLLLTVGVLVLIFLLTYVVPRFSAVYQEVDRNLPYLSRLLLDFGQFLNQHGWAFAVGTVATLIVAARLVYTQGARRWTVNSLLRIPALGERARLYQLSRFYRTMGMLLRGGTPIVAAIDMASGLLGVAMQPALRRVRQDIREGSAISDAMARHGMTTPVVLRMLRVGERTGRMDDMMERIAGFIDEEVSRWIEWFSRLFEPLLMAVIGLVIGGIVILMYLPVFELAGSIQ